VGLTPSLYLQTALTVLINTQKYIDDFVDGRRLRKIKVVNINVKPFDVRFSFLLHPVYCEHPVYSEHRV